MEAQSKAMQDSANAVKESNRISVMTTRNDQRAWVGPRECIKPTPQELEKGGTGLIFGVNAHNTGKTPALEVKNDTGLRFLPPGAKFEPIYTFRPNSPESLTVIFPNSYGTVTGAPVDLSQQQIGVLKQGKMILYLFGRIEYRDTARQVHPYDLLLLARAQLGRFQFL